MLSVLEQKVPSDLELLPEEYSVMIGPYPCNISFHNDQLFHCTMNGLPSSSESELPVTVSMKTCTAPAHASNPVLKIFLDRP